MTTEETIANLIEACKRLIKDSEYMRNEYSDMNQAVVFAEEAIKQAEAR